MYKIMDPTMLLVFVCRTPQNIPFFKISLRIVI